MYVFLMSCDFEYFYYKHSFHIKCCIIVRLLVDEEL